MPVIHENETHLDVVDIVQQTILIDDEGQIALEEDVEVISLAEVNSVAVLIESDFGPQGIPGISFTREVFVGPNTPIAVADEYIWVQTGLAPGGAGFTFWFNDPGP